MNKIAKQFVKYVSLGGASILLPSNCFLSSIFVHVCEMGWDPWLVPVSEFNIRSDEETWCVFRC